MPRPRKHAKHGQDWLGPAFNRPFEDLMKQAKTDDCQLILPVLADCMMRNLVRGVPIPHGVQEAFVDTFFRAITGQYKSWDEAFGPPLLGKKPAAEQKKWRLARKIYQRYEQLTRPSVHEGRRPYKKDDGLFKAIAKDLKINAATAKRIYYSTRDANTLVTMALQWEHDISREEAVLLESDPVDMFTTLGVFLYHPNVEAFLNSPPKD